MTVFQAFILGIVQGLTEFLPVSSSGHLVIFQKLFNINGDMVLPFDVALHLATLFAVIFIYWKKVLEMIRRPFAKLPVHIVLATVPAVVLTIFFKDMIEGTYDNAALLGPGFIFTGIALVLAERIGNGRKQIKELSVKDSLLIGTAQGIAILPSVSRSGMTITTGLALGLDRGFAADFSFLLCIPAILGAGLLDGVKLVGGNTAMIESIGVPQLLVGMAAAAVTGFLAIKWMLSAIKNMKMKYFAWYVMVLGLAIIIAQIFFKDAISWLV